MEKNNMKWDLFVLVPFEIKDEVMYNPAPWFQSYTHNK